MRKIILALAVSLDGYIEGPNGEYDWCFTDQDYGMTAFLERIDALLIGRKTYELMTNPAEEASNYTFPEFKKYVFSNTLTQVNESIEVINGDWQTKVMTLRQQSGKALWLYGGADLTTSFLNAGLVDELFLAVHPIILGSGKPLFQHINDRVNLTLIDSTTYSTGLVSLTYQLASGMRQTM